MDIIEFRKDHIFAQYSEKYTKKIFFELMEKAFQKSQEVNCYNIFLDVSKMAGKVSIMDRFEIGTKGATLFKGSYKVAVLYREEEINRFAETVGVNRGLNTRVFSDRNEAIKWLEIENV